MQVTLAPLLADSLTTYFDVQELRDTVGLFGIELRADYEYSRDERAYWLAVAKQLLEDAEHGKTHALLQMLLEQLELRNRKAVANTGWESRAAHEAYWEPIKRLQDAFAQSPSSSEITTDEGKPFTAKSQVRELLATATTELLVVDPYVGIGTLDCLREVSMPIRILTGTLQQSVESAFAKSLEEFRKEGFAVEVRRATMQHDRHLVFNDRCWLVGSSLKDAGKKPFNCIEVVDDKEEVVKRLEAKWQSGAVFV